MPGPWIGARENCGLMRGRYWGAGDLFERQMYDAGLNEQKKAFWEVITSGEKKHGTWRSATLIAVEDEHLLWWLTKGPGATQKREFLVHICSGSVGSCKAVDANDGFTSRFPHRLPPGWTCETSETEERHGGRQV